MDKKNNCEARVVFYCTIPDFHKCKYYKKTRIRGFDFCEHVSSVFCRCREANRDAYMAALKDKKERC